jgi:tetratricopeptide (TPR) repeat protein
VTFFRRSIVVSILVMLAVMGPVPSLSAAGNSAEAWSEQLRQARANKDDTAIVAALEGRAEALLALGFLSRAEADLLEALDRTGPDADSIRILRLKGLLGAVRTRIGDIDGARADLGEALLAASLAGARRLEAVTLNNIGNFLLLERRFDEAIQVYEESASIAAQTGDADTALAARLNAADVLIRQGAFSRAAEQAGRAAEILGEPEASAGQVSALIKLGRLNQAIAAGAPRLTRSQGRAAHRHFAAARQHAAALGDAMRGSAASPPGISASSTRLPAAGMRQGA